MGDTPAALAEICNSAARYALKQVCRARGNERGISAFDMLKSLQITDYKSCTISNENFQHAFADVSKSTHPEANMQIDKRIRSFCTDYNESHYRGTASGFFSGNNNHQQHS